MVTSKEIRTRDAGAVADLLCPRCGADNLHHGETAFYERQEDTSTVTRIIVDGGDVHINHRVPNVGNPSMRRDGMTIKFWCEQCGVGEPVYMTIAQHKGSTEIGWEYD